MKRRGNQIYGTLLVVLGVARIGSGDSLSRGRKGSQTVIRQGIVCASGPAPTLM